MYTAGNNGLYSASSMLTSCFFVSGYRAPLTIEVYLFLLIFGTKGVMVYR